MLMCRLVGNKLSSSLDMMYLADRQHTCPHRPLKEASSAFKNSINIIVVLTCLFISVVFNVKFITCLKQCGDDFHIQ